MKPLHANLYPVTYKMDKDLLRLLSQANAKYTEYKVKLQSLDFDSKYFLDSILLSESLKSTQIEGTQISQDDMYYLKTLPLFLEYKEKLWEIEIWFLDDINSSLKEMIQIENKLNQKNKLNILKEKKKRDKFNISKKELSSYKIYKDILNL